MMTNKAKCLGGLGLMMLVLGLWAGLVQADGNSLPDRATPTPTPVFDEPPSRDRGPVGAKIELSAPAQPGAWSAVQWQDSAGNWHDVPGWCGSLDAAGRINWWVAQKDFGTGPFRWVITQGAGGSEVGTSRPFNLPVEANQALRVEVTVR